MSQLIGTVEPFVLGESFNEYLSRINVLFEVNEIEAKKQTGLLLTLGGASLYKVASKVCDPEEPKLKPYEKLCELLKAHLSPVISVVAERFKFRNCLQKSEQVNEYVIMLKSAAQKCKFGAFLSEALRDQFVAGIKDNELRKQLLREEDISFEKATAIARTWEAAKEENEAMKVKPQVGEMAAVRRAVLGNGVRKQQQHPHYNQRQHPQQRFGDRVRKSEAHYDRQQQQ
uniref:Retrotransposon gag domain-containing protein n=1 Tax=Anopheles funestus TaxID=62324 RepID=A0A182S072_ANOFN